MIRPIDNWRDVLLHSWSVRIAALLSAIAGALSAQGLIAIGLIAFIPDPFWQLVVAAFVGVAVFGFPVIAARLVHQEKIGGKKPDA